MALPGAGIFGCAGTVLTPDEKAFFKELNPWGFILFARNIETPVQVCALTRSLKELLGRDAPVLIDQEGGRVARLRPPCWRAYPPAQRYAELYQHDPAEALEAARLGAQLIGTELKENGISVNCAPVLDIPVPEGHNIIGDRAYGMDREVITQLAQACITGLRQAGILPVIKHIPGHGRATADSHETLPVVDADAETLRGSDFRIFHDFRDMPVAMTGHVVYTAFDAENPATTSPGVVQDVIRGEIGFQGLLITDDLSMQALRGTFASRTRAALSAGCDLILHCNGEREEMEDIARELPRLDGFSLLRAEQALAWGRRGQLFDSGKAWAIFERLIA